MKVFYTEKQNVEKNESFSPSAGKPAKVVESWGLMNGVPSIEIHEPTPCSLGDLALAHDESFVMAVLSCQINNGFHNKSQAIANSLAWTNGSFVSAASHAFKSKESTCSPTSGFHHAGFDKSEGFCTFNGLMVAVQKLRYLGAKRIGILDLDMHWGNGTDDILSRLNLSRVVEHYTFGADVTTEFWRGGDAAINWLNKTLPEAMEKMSDCEVILYQAGADPHVNDPFGGALTTEQMHQRDKMVFGHFNKLDIPVAWNLAGGYQSDFDKVLEIHNNTRLAFWEVYGK